MFKILKCYVMLSYYDWKIKRGKISNSEFFIIEKKCQEYDQILIDYKNERKR